MATNKKSTTSEIPRFTPKQVEMMRNAIALYAEPDQVDAAHTIATVMSEDADDVDDPDALYVAILFHFTRKENAKELTDVYNTLTGRNMK
jgi:hypothetical protein